MMKIPISDVREALKEQIESFAANGYMMSIHHSKDGNISIVIDVGEAREANSLLPEPLLSELAQNDGQEQYMSKLKVVCPQV